MDSIDDHQPSSSPHVAIFPLPALGHVTPALHLAELLCLAKIQVTFLNTIHNHERLTKHSNIEARFASYPGFEFKTFSDRLPDDRPRTGKTDMSNLMKDLNRRLTSSAKPLLREVLVGSSEKAKATCLIVDGWLNFATDAANEADVPVIIFRCSSACCNSSLYSVPMLIEAGIIPFKDDENMDQLTKIAPEMESSLRYRDLPSFCRGHDNSSCRDLHGLLNVELQKNQQAHSLILNTFEDLEGPSLSHIRSKCSRVYSIGPLHAHLKNRLGLEDATMSNNSSSSLWEVDRSCISWLDHKRDKSVVYVSFGSLNVVTKDQLMEFWAGLVRSKKHFLWVIRHDLIIGNDSPTQDYDLLERTKERGYIVGWAPQEEVLTHRAIGGFLTHSGWNSTMESIVAGVPMLCWPYFGDQQVNSRFVSEVWRIGLDMKDTCDRTIIAKMINDLMEAKKDELQRSMDRLTNLAKQSITKGGSSYSTLNLLIEEIKSM